MLNTAKNGDGAKHQPYGQLEQEKFHENKYTGKVFHAPNSSPRLKTYGVDTELKSFLIYALDRGGWSASRPGRFSPGSTHWIGSLMGPTAGLGAMNDLASAGS